MEIDQQSVVVVLAEVVMMPTKDIYPDPAPTQTSEPEAIDELTVSSAAKQDKFPGAGQLYEQGKHRQDVLGEEFEDVGGFTVLKTQAPLYKEIWLNYGHIASSQVLTDNSQVVVVSELMNFIVDMCCYHLEVISSTVIESWEEKIKVAEKPEFNIGWLHERLVDIKEKLAEGNKLQETLLEQVIEAEQQLALAKEKLSALETKISPLLAEKQESLDKCGGPILLFNCGTDFVTSPEQMDANSD